jgi:hypothetical protein
MTLQVRRNYTPLPLLIPAPLEQRVYLALMQTLCPDRFGFNATTAPFLCEVLQKSTLSLVCNKGAVEFQKSVDSIMRSWHQTFKTARVQSYLELIPLILNYKELNHQALTLYFKGDAVALKYYADRALLIAADAWKKSTMLIIHNYWLTDDPWIIETHGQVEVDLNELSRMAIAIRGVLNAKPHLYSRYGHHFAGKLIRSAKLLLDIWGKNLETTKDLRMQKVLQYKILKAKIIYPSMIKALLRETLEPLICQRVRRKKRRLDSQELKEVLGEESPHDRKVLQFLFLTRLFYKEEPTLFELVQTRVWPEMICNNLLLRFRMRDKQAIKLFGQSISTNQPSNS